MTDLYRITRDGNNRFHVEFRLAPDQEWRPLSAAYGTVEDAKQSVFAMMEVDNMAARTVVWP